jgi:hypothetical protein
MCEYPSLLFLSHLFPSLFAHCTQFFSLQACVCRQRSSFFWVCFCFFLFCFCLQKFSLIQSSHLGASSSGRILKFCIKKNSVKISLCLFVFICFLGFFFFFFLGGRVCWRCRRCRSGFGFWGLVDADGCFGSDALLLYYCIFFFPDSFILLLI